VDGILQINANGALCHPERSEGSVWAGWDGTVACRPTHTVSSLRSE